MSVPGMVGVGIMSVGTYLSYWAGHHPPYHAWDREKVHASQTHNLSEGISFPLLV